ncbi:hypothetical protein B0H10DRAFT_1954443 [Mycena sp. CBHHK59/15]|nr:hypothetical protein B0H10DRAFT_1954443 [Mycena sp. CBHHK59/15]
MALNGQPPPARGSEQGLTVLHSGATLPDTEYIQGWFFLPPLFPVDRWLRTPLSAHGQSSGRGARSNLRAGDHYNILLSVRGASFEFSTLSESHLAPGLDPHRDSPCEILHSILLGDDKYVWHETNKVWDKPKGETFVIRLQSSAADGLNLPSLHGWYIVQYKNVLIGKHFKILQQLGVSTSTMICVARTSSTCGKHLADLQICIDNVLDIWGLVDPARIITKYKLHVLPHLPDDIRQFGPSILFQTEVFECWNGIFRLYSILSNLQASSHDIGVILTDMERFKHQARTKVISFLHHNKELQRRLGWMDKSKPKPGSIKLESRSKARSGTWRDLLEPYWTQELDIHGSGKMWTMCKYVVSKSGDVCSKHSWETEAVLAGWICDILIPSSSVMQHAETSVVIQRFNISATRDESSAQPLRMLKVSFKNGVPGGKGRRHSATKSDRDAKHKEFAALLRVSGPAKRAAALKKSKETREQNLKARKGVTAVGVEGDMNEEADSDPDAGGEH